MRTLLMWSEVFSWETHFWRLLCARCKVMCCSHLSFIWFSVNWLLFAAGLAQGAFEKNDAFFFRRGQRTRKLKVPWKERHFENYYGEVSRASPSCFTHVWFDDPLQKKELDRAADVEPLSRFSFVAHEAGMEREYPINNPRIVRGLGKSLWFFFSSWMLTALARRGSGSLCQQSV